MSQSDDFDEGGFWAKVANLPASAGCEVLRKALTLYCLLKDPEVPLWAKVAIVSALAYFISPVDAIPDFIPFAGYTDDAGVMATLLATLEAWVGPAVEAEVEALLPHRCT